MKYGLTFLGGLVIGAAMIWGALLLPLKREAVKMRAQCDATATDLENSVPAMTTAVGEGVAHSLLEHARKLREAAAWRAPLFPQSDESQGRGRE